MKKWITYLAERFPVPVTAALGFATAAAATARVDTWATARGAALMFLLLFHLRVFDEHKDYEEDCRHYTERVLQRGLITLRDLKILGGIAIGLEIVFCALRGPTPLAAWSVAFGFSVLMLKEFFVRD